MMASHTNPPVLTLLTMGTALPPFDLSLAHLLPKDKLRIIQSAQAVKELAEMVRQHRVVHMGGPPATEEQPLLYSCVVTIRKTVVLQRCLSWPGL